LQIYADTRLLGIVVFFTPTYVVDLVIDKTLIHNCLLSINRYCL